MQTTQTQRHRPILVISSDRELVNGVKRALTPCCEVAFITGADCGDEILHRRPWSGILIDDGCADTPTTRLLAKLVASPAMLDAPPVVAIACSASPALDLLRAARRARASFLPKPLVGEHALSFALRPPPAGCCSN